jgi:diguanylate cyclase
MISELFRQWESQSKITPAKKREALERVLEGASANPRTLFYCLEGLSRAWVKGDAATDLPLVAPLDDLSLESSPKESKAAVATDLTTSLSVGASERPNKAADLLLEIREMLAYVLDSCIAPMLPYQPALAKDAADLGSEIRNTTSLSQLEAVQGALKRFSARLALAVEDQIELRASLLKLLQLLIENTGELMQDDQWQYGQIAMIREILAQPLSPRALNDAETLMKEVVFKQSQLKLGLLDAKNALKNLLSGFVDHLAIFADETSDYHEIIEKCTQRISVADNIDELESVLAEVMRETRKIQYNAQSARDDLQERQQQVTEAKERIQMLELELAETSHMIRHDHLTGTMNRRGLEETLSREIARAERHELSICVSVLDIDDFKQLNDSQGHTAGDEALIHLTSVIRDTLRPQDIAARYGGEEFIILFPETDLEEASTAMARLQRNLTRRFFLFQNQKILITFSAGVAQLKPGEGLDSVIKRADDAMYTAKKAGKNLVIMASANDQNA